MKAMLLIGADQKYGTYHMAVNMIEASKEYCSDVEYVVVTQRQGPVNELCDELHIENYAVPYRYCVYAPSGNRMLDFFKRKVKKVWVCICMACAWIAIHRRIDFNQIDIIHTNNNRDLFGTYLSYRHKKPHLMHLREFTKEDFNLSPLFQKQLAYMNEHTDRFIAISHAIENAWVAKGLDSDKVTVIYDGIDPSSVSYEVNDHSERVVHMVMVGHISIDKGQIQLLEAIEKLSTDYKDRIRVDFYGDGERAYLDELNEYVIEHDLSKVVRFLGYQKNLNQKLCKYDVGFNCSKSEGFGLVTLEYMLAGVCPIVSDTGANVELVIDDETGFTYHYGNVYDLASKVGGAIENQENLKTMSEKSRRRAESLFSLKVCMEKTIDVYYGLHTNSKNDNTK